MKKKQFPVVILFTATTGIQIRMAKGSESNFQVASDLHDSGISSYVHICATIYRRPGGGGVL